jgi:hypothetical protein
MNQRGPGIEIKNIDTVQIDNETYQIQQVEFEDETIFFVRNSDQIVCMIMQNEKGEWEPDCEISLELFKHIKEHISDFS